MAWLAVAPFSTFAGARCLAFLRRQQRLTAEADLPRRVDIDDLDHDLLAFLQLVPHVLDPVMRDLGHVEQAVEAGHDFDERAEIGNALDLAQVRLVQLRRGGELLDDADRLLR